MSHRFSSQAPPLGNGRGVFGGGGWRGGEACRTISDLHLWTVYNPEWEQLIRRLQMLIMSCSCPSFYRCVSHCVLMWQKVKSTDKSLPAVAMETQGHQGIILRSARGNMTSGHGHADSCNFLLKWVCPRWVLNSAFVQTRAQTSSYSLQWVTPPQRPHPAPFQQLYCVTCCSRGVILQFPLCGNVTM